jgi:hypothetical protein
MSIKYACFISYPHGQANLIKTFVDLLKQALDDYLEPLEKSEVYIDKLRLNPGYNYNEGLAKAICQSACMIVVFMPIYEKSAYCLREFLAMECIEEKRKQMLGEKYDRTRRMIIPIVLRGDPQDLPPKIRDIHYCDYSKFLLATLTRNEEFDKPINTIAADIHKHCEDLEELESAGFSEECDSFVLPTEQDALKSWIRSTRSIGFPGRNIL